jgi:hypothetical protein
MIERVSGPTTLACKMAVGLNATPSRTWRAAFTKAAHTDAKAAGHAVNVVGSDVVFVCDAADVAATVTAIDRWIAVANGQAPAARPTVVQDEPPPAHHPTSWRERLAIRRGVRRAEVLQEF